MSLRVGEALDRVQLQEVLQVFWNRQMVYRFPEEGGRVEGDGDGTGAETCDRKGDGIGFDPSAAEVLDVVDGQGALVDGRGEDDDGVGFVPKVAEAGDGVERGVVDDGGKRADASGRLLEVGVVLDGGGPGYDGGDSHDGVSCKEKCKLLGLVVKKL